MLVAKAKDFTKCHHKELLSSKALILLQLTAVYTATKGRCASHRRVLNVPEVLWSHHDQEHGLPGIEKGVRALGYMFTSLSKASASVWAADISHPPPATLIDHCVPLCDNLLVTSLCSALAQKLSLSQNMKHGPLRMFLNRFIECTLPLATFSSFSDNPHLPPQLAMSPQVHFSYTVIHSPVPTHNVQLEIQ